MPHTPAAARKEKFLLFVPMYNCEKQITRVLAQLTPEIQARLGEVLVVNNRSTDNGERAAIESLKKITGCKATLVRNTENYGLGGSHKVAFQYGLKQGHDYCVVLHGDDQANINDAIPELPRLAKDGLDCHLGSRFMKGSRLGGYSAFRTFGNRVYNLLFSLVAGHVIHDLGSGLNIYRLPALAEGYYQTFPDNLTFNYVMLLASYQRRQRVAYFPISWREEDQRSNVKLMQQALRVLALLAGFALDRQRFFQKDMREKPVGAYSAETIYSNVPA